ncbi:type II toxin-antitoxin system Phd/YefM family antitoxin [Streptomyces sp. NBC_01264]|uniref:type II toxin-antitoxin system Phd/YefM family antitoxin n=1 Tax=Streptomyces sp. NBC_01264 TaxID=2903804 RepID=UPI00225412E4|nr:type II toxin-antitoxin system prevent-host-death family antitoxin [Streptomyces sp. NBC_01264]MCX4778851.1 type II toxin-antitoxin system prevent-host-death family antitoxin [Streptomyces sp. NBC_01264]
MAGPPLSRALEYTREAARQYTVHEKKTHFSKILEIVATGKEVIISKAGEPEAKVVPLAGKVRRTDRGSVTEPVVLREDFDDMSDDSGFAEAFGLLPTPGIEAAESGRGGCPPTTRTP